MDITMITILAGTASSLVMAGVIWIVQLLHYPSFHYVHGDQFPGFHRFHTRSISYVVVPVMLLELATAIAWIFIDDLPKLITWPSLLVVLALWITTFSVQVPIHSRLASGKDEPLINSLVKGNWIRTLLWSIKALLGLWLVKMVFMA